MEFPKDWKRTNNNKDEIGKSWVEGGPRQIKDIIIYSPEEEMDLQTDRLIDQRRQYTERDLVRYKECFSL